MARRRSRVVLGCTYALLLVSCESPFAPQDVSIDRIEATPATVAMTAGETRAVTARVLDAGGRTLSDRRVFWASQAPAVATVSQAGVITGVAAGTTQIAASAGGKSALVAVAVAARPVTLVRVTPATATLVAGTTTQLAAQPVDATGATVSGRIVGWATSNAAIATVSSTGLVSGTGAGSATITATVDGVAGSATVTVQPVPVASIAVTPATAALVLGQSVALTATPRDAAGTPLGGRPVTWASSDPAIASVSSSGVVTALAVGSATISASTEGRSATARITVSPVPVDSVVVSPRSATVAAGQTIALAVRLADANGNALAGRPVTWDTDQPAIATVNASGLVTAVAAGRATITAASEGRSGSAVVTVTPVAIASLSIAPRAATLAVGASQALVATARDAANNVVPGRAVTWISGAPSVATVSQAGVVTAVGPGTALVFAAAEGISTSATITVTTVGVAQVRMTPVSGTLSQGRTLQLVAEPLDAAGNVLTGRIVSWNSSAPTVASVSSTGLVTAIGSGSAAITATVEGVVGTTTLTVTPAAVSTVTVLPGTSTLTVGGSVALTLVLQDASGTTLAPTGRTIVWTSLAPSVASVSQTGVVTALAPGTAALQVFVDGVAGSALVTVTNVPVASVSLAPGTSTLQLGQSASLTATARDAGNNVLTGRPVTWASSNAAVATVASTTAGTTTVTAVAVGSATISATIGGVQGVATVTVTSVPIASLTVAPTSAALAVGATQALTVTALDAGGNVLTGRTFSFTSSAPAIASVSSAGTITAIAPGSATVTVTPAGLASPSATVAVTVTAVPVASLVLSPATATVTLGATPAQVFFPALFDAGGNALSLAGRTITWSSLDAGIATVNASTGVVTTVAASASPARIVASTPGASGTVADTSLLTVSSVPVASVTLTPATASVTQGQTQLFTAVARDAGNNVLTGRPVTWASTTPAVATINTAATGDTSRMTAVAVGSATISATIGGVQGVATVTVSSVPVATIDVTPSPGTVVERQSLQLTATPRDAGGAALTGRTIVWSSSNNAIASVSTAGLVTATAPGTVTISAAAPGQGAGGADPTPGTSNVTVSYAPVASVSSSPTSVSLVIGDSTTLTATLLDGAATPQVLSATGRTVAWRSLNTSVATVNAASGRVTAVASGGPVGIEVSASSPGQATPALDTSFVTVNAVPVANISITPGPTATVRLGTPYARTFTAVTRDAGGNVLSGRPVVWTSENQSIAQVTSSGGVVTGLATGATYIKATSESRTDSVAVTVDLVVISSSFTTVTIGAGQADSTLPGAANARTFTATPRDSAGNVISGSALASRVPTWALTSGSSSATLAATGASATVTPVSAGAVAVQADYGGGVAPSATLKVLVPVASVLLTAASDSFYVGDSTAVTATARDAGNSAIPGRVLTLASSASAVAGVGTTSGTQTIATVVRGASAPGGRASATLTATATLDNVSGTKAVTVLAPVNAIAVATPTGVDSVYVPLTLQASATLTDANGNVLSGRPVTWSSGNTSVATVNASGLVAGVGAGSAAIQASAEGKSGSKTVKVVEAVNAVALTTGDSSIFVGQTQQATVALTDRLGATVTGRVVTYASSNTAVATISASGLVTAVGAGSTNLTATSEGKVSPALPFTVSLVPVASVTVAATPTPTVYPSHVFPASVQAFDASNASLSLSGRTIVWTSNTPSVATVSAGTGGAATITAVATGSASITATVDGVAAAAPITFTVQAVPVASVTVAPASESVQVGASATPFTATARDSAGSALAGRTLTWSSANTGKATVASGTGQVTGVDSGTVNIVATATGQGVGGTSPSGQASLAVTLVPIGSVTLTPSAVTLAATTASDSVTVEVKSAGGGALAGRACTLVSSDTSKLTVSTTSPALTDAAGRIVAVFTGVATGSATLTVTCDAGSASPTAQTATITVP